MLCSLGRRRTLPTVNLVSRSYGQICRRGRLPNLLRALVGALRVSACSETLHYEIKDKNYMNVTLKITLNGGSLGSWVDEERS